MSRPHAHARADLDDALPLLRRWLLGALFLGAVAMLSLPAARSLASPVGAMPLWLIGMPLASLAALALRARLRAPPRMTAPSVPSIRRRAATAPARGAVRPRRRALPRAA
ncbi:hypothetical protein [Luteimonas huabeiensis]|uniref:hypothetical protein n=1 Tax=Luteimonas huabeiensis TaxID=1244513 RepID=UPI000465046C|nr:hypothetical protein [Luteimonas huabeiensis]